MGTAAPDLLHVVGYLTGASLFAMLLAMVVRTGAPDRLMMVTAALGLAWNVGELLVQGTRPLESSAIEAWLQAASYAALGGLAAVVIHSVTSRSAAAEARGRWPGLLTVAGYALAGTASALHVMAAAAGAFVPSRTALVLLTGGLAVLAPALVLTTRRQATDSRALWMTALTLFAVSALHLGGPHSEGESWVLELVGHHASIPLAFAILYEDYRFALADLFLKQALTLIAVVMLVSLSWSAVTALETVAGAHGTGVLLAVWVATAMAFPVLRRSVVGFVDRFVLRRADYAHLLERFAAALQESDEESVLLDRVCTLMTPALNATLVRWHSTDATVPTGAAAHRVVVQTADVPQFVLVVERLGGGRRLLSDDITLLERVGTLTARRIDAVRLTNERYDRVLREQEMQALATEAELRALRAQINPHFLFNALTTIGYLIQQAPPRALDTLMRLTTLLRGVLKSEGEMTTLGQECELLECYLDIERERFEERLRVEIDVPRDLRVLPIPALIVQPLVENAIKHGIAPVRQGGSIRIAARLSADARALAIVVRNTGAPMLGATATPERGVGLGNVKRRLACCYGDAARLTLGRQDDVTVAEVVVPVRGAHDLHVTVAARAVASR